MMVALRTDATLVKGRDDVLSFKAMRSSSGMYSWLPLLRVGTS
jgi:hypothetical protein